MCKRAKLYSKAGAKGRFVKKLANDKIISKYCSNKELLCYNVLCNSIYKGQYYKLKLGWILEENIKVYNCILYYINVVD